MKQKRLSKPKRKILRLKDYDYSSVGWYYVTICTQDQKCLFGKIINEKMVLNSVGEMIAHWWLKLPNGFVKIELDVYQIMPNHIHGIIIINENFVGAGLVPARNNKRKTNAVRATTRVAPTLGDIVGTFKSLTTHEYINGVKNRRWKPFHKRLWQRNYYEHIIRHQEDLNQIRQYTKDNPQKWAEDQENPKKLPPPALSRQKVITCSK